MNHTIEGKKFCITGKLSVYDRDGAEAAIVDAGGLIAKSVGPKTDFLVVGARAGSKLAKAKKLGIPVIEEADLESFLAGEVVEVEDIVASGEASVRDLIGEARAALDGHPDSETWSSIVEIVDSCAPDQLEGLIAYLEPQIARWEMTPSSKWAPKKGSHGVEDAGGAWLRNMPGGELRMAPHSWLSEMISKHDVPKHSLVRGIHLEGFEANARVCKEIVSRTHLTNLRWLDLGRSQLSSVFWRAFRKLETMGSVELLRLAMVSEKGVGAIDGPHNLTSLRELVIWPDASHPPVVRAILGAELAQGIETLTFDHNWPDAGLKSLDASLLPQLAKLRFMRPSHDRVHVAIDQDLTARVGNLTVRKDIPVGSPDDPEQIYTDALAKLSLWTEGTTAGPELLDLSEVGFAHSNVGIDPALARAALVRIAEVWALPPATTRLSFGEWWSEELAHTWAKRGVTTAP